uniref:Condensin-2 complex subunit H2 n=2 Tax=Lygus hesperus TaxID=30085 RepID=A0A0A9XWH5_LYGHE
MGDQQRVGYEDLLKPLKDVLLKNWRMSLAHVLDEFISHLQNEGIAMNFSQAAILLQNSTTFYCKRVDVVFQIMEELTDGISQLYMAIFCHFAQQMAFANEEPSTSTTPTKKRRPARTLENDDLELLDFVHTDQNIDLNWRKFLEAPPPKQIVLNKDVKAVKKPNTSIPLVGSNGIFMGYKDDYRLYGKTWSDGTINDEFFNRNHEVSYWNGSDIEANGVCDNDSHFDEQMDTSTPLDGLSNGLSNAPKVEESSKDLGNSVSFNINEPPPLKELKVNLCKVVDWDPVKFEFKFPLKALKRRRPFALPKQLIAEAEEEMERQKKRKLRQEKKAAKLSNGVANGIDHTIDEGGDHCCAEPDPEDVVELPKGDSEILKFKQQRRESGLLATEIAKRVSEWHEAVLPKIQEAEKRRKFNVHEYGGRILDQFPDTDQNFRPFTEIVEGQPKHEICRHFLSCLMLANTYNVEIRKSNDAPLATDCLELKLLTKVRHHDEMDEQLENLS